MKVCQNCGSHHVKAIIKKMAVLDLSQATPENPNGGILQEGSKFAVIEMSECAQCKTKPVVLVENVTCPSCGVVCEQDSLDAYGKCAICYAKESATELFDLTQEELVKRLLQSKAHIASSKAPASTQAPAAPVTQAAPVAAPVQTEAPAPVQANTPAPTPVATTAPITTPTEVVVAGITIPAQVATDNDVQELIQALTQLDSVDISTLTPGQKGGHTKKMNKYKAELEEVIANLTGTTKTAEVETPAPAPEVEAAPVETSAPAPMAPADATAPAPAPAPSPVPVPTTPAPPVPGAAPMAPVPGAAPVAPTPGVPGMGAPAPAPAPAPVNNNATAPNVPGDAPFNG